MINSDFISIVVPVRDERENIEPLCQEIKSVMSAEGQPFEIVFVDDHSADGTDKLIESLLNADDDIRLIQLREDRGKDSALSKGILAAKGEIIVTMDGDLQNNPADIPSLVRKLNGFEMVCGIRAQRDDPLLKMTVSKIANWVRNLLVRDNIIDAGCALRAMAKNCADSIIASIPEMFGAAHYFYPSIAKLHGFKVRQIPISHRSRNEGKSKFALMNGRMISGIRACLVARRLRRELSGCRVLWHSQMEHAHPEGAGD